MRVWMANVIHREVSEFRSGIKRAPCVDTQISATGLTTINQ